MRGCVVPGCKTGYKSVKAKCSAFKVPKNQVLREKWEAAIPGIQILKDTQCVCDKHFEPHCIIRKWEKRDAHGKIIASVLLQRPRLTENAVPSLFGGAQAPRVKSDDVTSNEVPPVPNTIQQITTNEAITSSALDVHYDVVFDDCWTNTEVDSDPDPSSNTCIESETCIADVPETMESLVDIQEQPVKPASESQQEQQQPTNFPQFIDVATIRLEHNYTESCLLGSEITCVTTGTICTKSETVRLPKSWNVKEKMSKSEKYLMFMHVIERKINDIECPMIQRYVMINCRSAQIRYYVHGLEVKSTHTSQLPTTLTDITLVPAILIKFQRLRICQGLGTIDANFMRDDDAYKDVLDDWRHNECNLLTKSKKCEHCRKSRKILIQRQARAQFRSANGIQLKRIHNPYNEIDQQKLNAMRIKLNLERRKKNRALQQIKKLHDNLQESYNKISEIEDKSFEAKCRELGVSETQKLTLTEIISAAKSGPNGRRYSHDWLSLCKSMNVKSPEVYEFLRSRNVIPLPCTRTIQKYYSKESTECSLENSLP